MRGSLTKTDFKRGGRFTSGDARKIAMGVNRLEKFAFGHGVAAIFTSAFIAAKGGRQPRSFPGITPSALTGDENNYNPSGWTPSIYVLRLEASGADRTLTGLAGGSRGRLALLLNVGSANDVILANQDTGSDEANRFLLPGGNDLAISPDEGTVIWWDVDSERWRQVDVEASGSSLTFQNDGSDLAHRAKVNAIDPIEAVDDAVNEVTKLQIPGLTDMGTGRYIVGVNAAATEWEYQQLLSLGDITIDVSTPGQIVFDLAATIDTSHTWTTTQIFNAQTFITVNLWSQAAPGSGVKFAYSQYGLTLIHADGSKCCVVTACEDTPCEPFVHLVMNETSGNAEDEVNGLDFTETGTITGDEEWRYLEAANTEYFERAHSSDWNLSSESFGISIKTIPNNSSSEPVLVAKQDGTQDWVLGIVSVSGGVAFFWSFNGNTVTSSVLVSDEVEYAVIAWFDVSDGSIHIDVNGTHDEAGSGITSSITSVHVVIGQNGLDANYYDGPVKDFRAFKCAPTEEQRHAIRNNDSPACGHISPGHVSAAAIVQHQNKITALLGLTGAIQAPTAIQDSSGQKLIDFPTSQSPTGSAVNHLSMENATTGNGPTLFPAGDDTNIDLVLGGKGTGGIDCSGDQVKNFKIDLND